MGTFRQYIKLYETIKDVRVNGEGDQRRGSRALLVREM